jgi:predicted dehydrogenase
VVNVGIVGLGKMGTLHAGIVNALSDSRVTAVCESEMMVAKIAKKLLRRVSFYSKFTDMINHETIDAVFITTPIQSHLSIIQDLLATKTNIGLFVEKPLAANGRDARALTEETSIRNVTNMVGFQKRFSPVMQHAKKLVDAEAIGVIHSVNCYSYTSDVFRKGGGWRFRKGSGGVLLDLGPHLLDLLLWYFGEPEHISATEESIYSTEVEDKVHADITFRSNIECKMDVSWSQHGFRLPEIRMELQGSNGSMVVSDDYVSVQADKAVTNIMQAGRQVFQKPSFNTSVTFLLADPEYTIEDECFLKAVRDKSHVEPNFKTASQVNGFIDSIHEAARRG